MKRKLLSACFALLCSWSLYAQDPHFSQFFASPLTLNPALTGRFVGDFRIAGNYRNQWPTINNAYTTFSLSADKGIMKKRIPENDVWGLGLMAYADEQADGVLKNTFYSLSTAYHKGIDEEGLHQISAGFQATYAQKRLNTANLKFEDQLRSDGFTGITNEIFDPRQLNINYFDINAGVLYSGVAGSATDYYMGASMYHINQPRETFTGAQFQLQPRFTLHGGLATPVGASTTLHTSAIYQNQGGAYEAVLGGALGFNINNDMEFNPATFYAGSWLRWKDALIPYIGLEWSNFRFGASYDVNISNLRTVSNSQGGFEISLIYIGRKNTEQGIRCPKF